MPRFITSALIVLASFGATACMSSHILITVRPDGSGTIEQTILFSPKGVEAFGQTMNPGQKIEPFKPMHSGEFVGPAERAGLELVSAEPLDLPDGRVGGKANFRFSDIRRLRLDQDLGIIAIAPGAVSGPIDVAFTRSPATRSSTLTLTLLEGRRTGLRRLTVPPNWHMLPRLAEAFQDFRIAVDVMVEGDLITTNSLHVAGKRVTVVDYNLNGLLADRPALERIAAELPPTAPIAEVRRALKSVAGMKFNDGPVVVEFR